MFDFTQRVVGVDLGDQKSLACVYSQGVIVEWFEFAMTPDGVRAAAHKARLGRPSSRSFIPRFQTSTCSPGRIGTPRRSTLPETKGRSCPATATGVPPSHPRSSRTRSPPAWAR